MGAFPLLSTYCFWLRFSPCQIAPKRRFFEFSWCDDLELVSLGFNRTRLPSGRRPSQYLRGVFAIHPLKACVRQAESIQTPVIAELLAFVEVFIQRF